MTYASPTERLRLGTAIQDPLSELHLPSSEPSPPIPLFVAMENFVNLAKKGLDAYEQHQKSSSSNSESNYGKTGGAEYNSPHHSEQGRPNSGSPQFDHDDVVKTAQEHGSGDSSLFSSAMSFISSNKGEHQNPIDEGAAQEAHKKAYHEDSASSMDASSIGSAAALQILKRFTSGSGSGSDTKSSGGGSQSQLISMAMAEATKLFDKSGGASSGNKQDAVNSAAMTVVKLMVQSKFSGGGSTGGSSSGGLGSLLSLASKFS